MALIVKCNSAGELLREPVTLPILLTDMSEINVNLRLAPGYSMLSWICHIIAIWSALLKKPASVLTLMS